MQINLSMLKEKVYPKINIRYIICFWSFLELDSCSFNCNWPFVTSPTFLTVAMSDKLSHHTSCSHAEKNTLQSKEETDNAPAYKTEQVTLGMKQSLSF